MENAEEQWFGKRIIRDFLSPHTAFEILRNIQEKRFGRWTEESGAWETFEIFIL